MSIQNKYKRIPKELPQKKGSSEVVSQIVSENDKTAKNKPKKTKKATFLLDEELHKRLRIYAAENEKTMVDIVERALNKYIEK